MNTNASGTAAQFGTNCFADLKDDEISYLFNGDDSINNEDDLTVFTNRCAEMTTSSVAIKLLIGLHSQRSIL